MLANMDCGEIGEDHGVSQARYTNTAEPYYWFKISYGCRMILKSESSAEYYCDGGSRSTFSKK
jgi:hypothetical protein